MPKLIGAWVRPSRVWRFSAELEKLTHCAQRAVLCGVRRKLMRAVWPAGAPQRLIDVLLIRHPLRPQVQGQCDQGDSRPGRHPAVLVELAPTDTSSNSHRRRVEATAAN